MEAAKQVIFQLGEEEYGFDINLVNAIEVYNGIVPVPNAPEYILGLLNLRGDVIPIYSLRKKFGLAEGGVDSQTQLIITRSNGVLIGFKVDAVKEIVSFEENELLDIPIIIKCEHTSYASKVANKNGRMILLLNHDGILNEEEKKALDELAEN